MMMTMLCKPGMRAAMLAVCAAALSAAPAMAQDNSAPAAPPSQDHMGPPMGGRGGMQERQLEMLTKRLNLTPDQVTQVKAIDADTMKQSMAVRNDTSLSQDDKHAKMMDIHTASQAKIRALLTDDQKTKYDAMQAEMKARMQNHQGGGAPPPAPPQ
jgi:Spy/CpxP family protein refolding chaperone